MTMSNRVKKNIDFNRRLEWTLSQKPRKVHRKRDKREQRERTKASMDSDDEYEQLTSRVWKEYENRKARSLGDINRPHMKRMKKSDDGTDMDSESEEKSIDGHDKESEDGITDNDEAYRDILEQSLRKNTATMNGTTNYRILISSSDVSSSDQEYVCEGEADSIASSQWSEPESFCSLYKEREELMIELIKIVGEKNSNEGSFLDFDKAWSAKVKEFKDRRISLGNASKAAHDSHEESRQPYKDLEDGDDEAFQGIFDGDKSDNDDASDTEWEPSDCEMDEQEAVKTETKEKDVEAVMEEFLMDFYKWLIDVDGGYRSNKMAQQYKLQVKSVIRRLQLNDTVIKAVQPKPPALYLLLHLGKDGVTLLKMWLSYAMEKYQPGTVRSYLMSLRLFIKFLTQERKSHLPGVRQDTLSVCQDYMTSWSAVQKKKSSEEKA